MKRFDNWLVDFLDTRYYASRFKWSTRMWARLAAWSADRYWRKYNDAPTVHNN